MTEPTKPISDSELETYRRDLGEFEFTVGNLTVTAFIARIDTTESQLREAKGEVEGLRAALKWIALFSCDEGWGGKSGLDNHGDQFDQWCQSCIAVAALAAIDDQGEHE